MPTTVYVCTTCDTDLKKTDTAAAQTGLIMQKNVRALVKSLPQSEQKEIKVKGIKCMGGCERACSVGITAPNKQACLFVDLKPEDTADILAIIKEHQRCPIGRIRLKNLPEHLAPKYLCRIPQPAAS